MPLVLLRATNYVFALIIPLSNWEKLGDTQLWYNSLAYVQDHSQTLTENNCEAF